MKFIKRILAGLLLVMGMSSYVMAGVYDKIPKGWNKIGLPGTLSVGAEYCPDYNGNRCLAVGNDIVGFNVGGTAIGGIQGCQMMPETEVCQQARIPVEVIAGSGGHAIVRLNGKNYAVNGLVWSKQESDGSFIGGPVSVIYQGVSIPLQMYHPALPSSTEVKKNSTELSANLSAQGLYNQCEKYSPSCYAFINQVYDWMLSNESKVGRLCDITNDANVHMSDSNGNPLTRTPADMIATYYMMRRNKAWFQKATAMDTVISTIQESFECNIDVTIIEPGSPGFPSPPSPVARIP
jgi:hypothetical protein